MVSYRRQRVCGFLWYMKEWYPYWRLTMMRKRTSTDHDSCRVSMKIFRHEDVSGSYSYTPDMYYTVASTIFRRRLTIASFLTCSWTGPDRVTIREWQRRGFRKLRARIATYISNVRREHTIIPVTATVIVKSADELVVDAIVHIVALEDWEKGKEETGWMRSSGYSSISGLSKRVRGKLLAFIHMRLSKCLGSICDMIYNP